MVSAEELREILKNEKDRHFTIFDTPVVFKEYFAGQDIESVELHSIATLEDESAIYFVGAFEWKNDTVKSLDGDSYNPDMKVYGYEWWSREDLGIDKGLDILVGSDWG